MTGEPTERDVEALADRLRRAFWDPDNGGQWEKIAAAVLASDWYAERIAEARREGAAEVVARGEALADEWRNKAMTNINEHNYAVGAIRSCGARLLATLRGDA